MSTIDLISWHQKGGNLQIKGYICAHIYRALAYMCYESYICEAESVQFFYRHENMYFPFLPRMAALIIKSILLYLLYPSEISTKVSK